MFKKIRIKRQEKKLKKAIEEYKHKVFKVFIKLKNNGIIEELLKDDPDYNKEDSIYYLAKRMLMHDISCYEPKEFEAYRKFYFPINKEDYIEGTWIIEDAKRAHIKANDHHWENRKENRIFNISEKYAIIENVCDWIARGLNYNIDTILTIPKIETLSKDDLDFLKLVLYKINRKRD